MKLFDKSSSTNCWFTLIIIFMIIPLMLTGCDKDDDDEEDTYYVKYEIGIGAFEDATNQVTVATGINKYQTICLHGTDNKVLICGPFKKGFEAEIIGSDKNKTILHGYAIYVSKNNEPFVYKASADNNDQYLEYTICD